MAKGTLSNWSQEVELTAEQKAAIVERAGPGSRRGVPVDTQWRRQAEIKAIRAEAREFAVSHLDDAHFVAGVVLYWGEGAKTRNYMDLSNGDPGALRCFVNWVRTYLDAQAEFVLALHLHDGNDEDAAKQYWRRETGLADASFTKTFIKPTGTGHRKNQLEYGVCRVRTRNASNHWHKVMVWIDVVAQHYGSLQSVAG